MQPGAAPSNGGHHAHRGFQVWLCCPNYLLECPLQPGIERRYNRQESRNSQFSGNSGNADSSVHGTNEARRSAELHGSESCWAACTGLQSGLRCCMVTCSSLLLPSPAHLATEVGGQLVSSSYERLMVLTACMVHVQSLPDTLMVTAGHP